MDYLDTDTSQPVVYGRSYHESIDPLPDKRKEKTEPTQATAASDDEQDGKEVEHDWKSTAQRCGRGAQFPQRP
jgi:hypothetical protein